MPRCVNLSGQVFGRLKVLRPAPNIKESKRASGRTAWVCLCQCGIEKVIPTSSLRSGNTTSCGCFLREKLHSNFHDLTGQVFGKLTVINADRTISGHGLHWYCRCECGVYTSTSSNALVSGRVHSCGCIRRLLSEDNIQAHRQYNLFCRGAARRNIEVRLTEDEWKLLVSKNCHYCGSAPANVSQPYGKEYGKPFLYNGIDRLDSDGVYEITNCVAACKICNYGKGPLTKEEFLSHIEQIYLRHRGGYASIA